MKHRQHKLNDTGSTLYETMVALILLTLVVGFTLRIYLKFNLKKTGLKKTSALSIAMNEMEQSLFSETFTDSLFIQNDFIVKKEIDSKQNLFMVKIVPQNKTKSIVELRCVVRNQNPVLP